jgi:hypothetical protein
MEDPAALEDELAIADERMMISLMADDPGRFDFGAHAVSTRLRPALERLKCNQRKRHTQSAPSPNQTPACRGLVTFKICRKRASPQPAGGGL